jgi:hypothetical protein
MSAPQSCATIIDAVVTQDIGGDEQSNVSGCWHPNIEEAVAKKIPASRVSLTLPIARQVSQE